MKASRLFGVLRRLAGEGRTVILVPHRCLPSLTGSAVMRAGRVVATLDIAATDADSLAELMPGQPGCRHVRGTPTLP